MRSHRNPQQVLMIQLEGEDRAIRRSVVTDKRVLQPGDLVRVDFLGGWPVFEVVGTADDALVVRPYDARAARVATGWPEGRRTPALPRLKP